MSEGDEQQQEAPDSPMPSTEIHVLSISECFVYKVPPLRSASGHRAEEWNLEHPLFTGCLKIYQLDTKLRILLFTYKDPNHMIVDEEHILFFGECPCEVKPGESIVHFVDGVIDSSRYYVLRIKDPKSTRTTLIGIGFRERETAFDFKNALNEYVKYVDRMNLAAKLTSSHDSMEEGNNSAELLPPLLHLDEHIAPLKVGEKITIKVKLNSKHNKHEQQHDLNSFSNDQDGFTTIPTVSSSSKKLTALKPPPPPAASGLTPSMHAMKITPSAQRLSFDGRSSAESNEDTASTSQTTPYGSVSSTDATTNDDEWGDFTAV